MKPGKLDLPTIWRGCDWPAVVLNWKDAGGNPFDLTGWRPRAFTRNGYDLNAVILNATQGRTQINLARNKTALFSLGVQQWDWIWEGVRNSQPYRYPPFLSGSVTIKDPITSTPLPLDPLP